jgi:hypothetical protein
LLPARALVACATTLHSVGSGRRTRRGRLPGAVAAVAGLAALLFGSLRRQRRERVSSVPGALGVGSASPEADRRAAAAEAAGRFQEAMRLQPPPR